MGRGHSPEMGGSMRSTSATKCDADVKLEAVVEQASDPRVGGFAERYHVPTTGRIGSGMGG
jgi:hypothetical protein